MGAGGPCFVPFFKMMSCPFLEERRLHNGVGSIIAFLSSLLVIDLLLLLRLLSSLLAIDELCVTLVL
jgi:hypothetical protein